jgi:hypothetical protein
MAVNETAVVTGNTNNAEIQAAIAERYVDPVGQITESDIRKDVETDTIQFEKRAAVKLVLDDAAQADNYVNILQWASGWTLADVLYQSPASTSAFNGGQVAQANVPKFMVSNHINSIIPKMMEGIFYEKPPFELRPRPGIASNIIEAKKALFTAQMDVANFEIEMERMMLQLCLFGTGIMKWGYFEDVVTEEHYQRLAPKKRVEGPNGSVSYYETPESRKFKVVYQQKLVSYPWIKFCDLRTILVDPGCRTGDIRDAKWIIHRDYVTYADLDQLRGLPDYDIPSEEELKMIFISNPSSTGTDNIPMTIPEMMYGYIQHALPRNYKTSADPMQTPLEILERWDNEKVITVLSCNGHNILLRNAVNPYRKKPFLSANWRDIPDSFYGQGLGILLGSEQLVEQGVTNLALDLLAYLLQPLAVRKRGINTLTQNIRWRQGGIIDVDEDVDKAFKFLEMPGIPSEAWQAISQSQAAGAASSGANEQVIQGTGSAGVRSTGMRSGTGAAAVIQANASRLDGPTSRIIRQIFEPWLAIMDNLNNKLLPTEVLEEILGEKLGKELAAQVDHIDFREGRMEYEVLVGAKLGAKKEMAQFLPVMIQLMTAPAFNQGIADANYVWDPIAIFKQFSAAAGWKYAQAFLRPMTPQEIQKKEANSPAALAARQQQAQQQQEGQKFQQDMAKMQEEQLYRGGNEILRSATEHALEPEVTGEPAKEGFGTTTAL